MIKRLVLAGAIVALTLTAARAGITDPTPSGFIHVWTVPGVIHNGNIGTAFVCTATDANTVSVEVFDGAGTLKSNGSSATLSAGQSATFATQALPNLATWLDMGTTGAFQGSARVIATTSKVLCTAFYIDIDAALITTLPILKKTKQKGD